MRQNALSTLIRCSRPPFLLLTPCCLSIAYAFAVAEQKSIDIVTSLLILAAAVSAHVSVNLLNEYEDFRSGLDQHTRRTAFSGGSGALPAAPGCAPIVRLTGLLCLAFTLTAGFYLVWRGGWLPLLPLGLAGVALVYFYSSKITRRPWLCLLAPGLGFGPIMIVGTYTLLNGERHAAVLSVSLIVLLLVSDLLLLNQFPDLEPDRAAGRRHLPILIGRKRSAWVYLAFLLVAYALLLLTVFVKLLPVTSLMALATLLLAIPAAARVLKYHDDMPRLLPALGLNVGLTLSLPLAIALGLVWGGLPPP